MTNKTPCYYMPKQVMTAEYSDFSVESKMLFSMIFTNAEHTKTIYETAELINSIETKDLYTMRHEFVDNYEESEDK